MRRVALVLSLGLALSASADHLGTLLVDCSGATPGAFPSINAAISSLPSIDGKRIRIKGTCTERVSLFRVDHVRLEGNPTATLLHDGSPDDFRILHIDRSTDVTLKNLTIGAVPAPPPAFTPVQVQRSTVLIEDCTLQGGSAQASGALWITDDAQVRLTGTTIQNSTPSGIRVDVSQLQLGGVSGGTNVIQFNPVGVRLRSSNVTIWGNNTIRQNGTGVSSTDGHVFLCCTNGLVISDNVQTGITLTLGASLQANNPVTFENNGLAAVRMFSGSALLNSGQIFRGNAHAAGGIAAVYASGNAHLELSNAQVVDNLGHGVLLEDSSSGRLFNNTIRNNRGNGVRVTSMSVAAMFGTQATGNATDLFCAPSSFARGDDSGFAKRFCPGFDQSPDPGGGN